MIKGEKSFHRFVFAGRKKFHCIAFAALFSFVLVAPFAEVVCSGWCPIEWSIFHFEHERGENGEWNLNQIFHFDLKCGVKLQGTSNPSRILNKIRAPKRKKGKHNFSNDQKKENVHLQSLSLHHNDRSALQKRMPFIDRCRVSQFTLCAFIALCLLLTCSFCRCFLFEKKVVLSRRVGFSVLQAIAGWFHGEVSTFGYSIRSCYSSSTSPNSTGQSSKHFVWFGKSGVEQMRMGRRRTRRPAPRSLPFEHAGSCSFCLETPAKVLPTS